MRSSSIVLSFALLASSAFAQQTPVVEWQKVLGGSGDDLAYSIKQTNDGGYVLAGHAGSPDGDLSVDPTKGAWVIKLDSSGNMLWHNRFGGSDFEQAHGIQQTNDGGFILAGVTRSNNGDASGNHGLDDMWVVKISALGNLSWQKQLGGANRDVANAIQQTSDGGFIVAGYTKSNDGDALGNHGGEDIWVVKLDAQGNISWQRQLGGSSDERAFSIQQTNDGGYVVAGFTESNDGDVSGNHGSSDYWVLKLNPQGFISWQVALGGSDDDRAASVQQTNDGGYILAGWSLSNDGDVSGNHGLGDTWVIKLDDLGGMIWQKSLGGSDWDAAGSIQQTTDGGYLLAGSSSSNDGDVSGNHGLEDMWVAKLDELGNMNWQKSLGGASIEAARSFHQTTDGGYIMAGYTDSNDGDVSGNNFANSGLISLWVVKLSPDLSTDIMEEPDPLFALYPNPVNDELFITLPSEDQGFVQVHDLKGKLVLSESYNAARFNLDLGTLKPGPYTISINGNHLVWKEKLIRQ